MDYLPETTWQKIISGEQNSDELSAVKKRLLPPISDMLLRATLLRWSWHAAYLDHFVDPDEMVVHPLAAVEIGGAGGFDDRLKIPVIGVAENLGEVPTRPKFVVRRIGAADLFKEGDFVLSNFQLFCQCMRNADRNFCLTHLIKRSA